MATPLALKILDSICKFADPEILTIGVNKSSIFTKNWNRCIFAYVCPNLVAMATPLAPLKIYIAYMKNCVDILNVRRMFTIARIGNFLDFCEKVEIAKKNFNQTPTLH